MAFAPCRRRALTAAAAALLALIPAPGCAPRDASLPVVTPDPALRDPAVRTMLEGLVHAVRAAPADARARGRLGMGYDAVGAPAAAARCYAQAATLDPAEPRWWYHAAVVQDDLGDPVRAAALLDSTLARDPEYAPAWWRLGFLHLALGDLDAAGDAFRRSASLRSAHPAPALGLARIHLMRDEPAEAERLLREQLDKRPNSPFAPYLHQLLGAACRAQGRMEDAEREIAQGRTGRPPWTDPWRDELDEFRVSLAAQLHDVQERIASGQAADALATLTALRETYPTHPAVLQYLGSAYLSLGRLDEARAVLEEAVTLRPGDTLSRLNLADIQARRGDLAGALATIDAAIATDPAEAVAHARRADMLQRLGRTAEARAALDAALAAPDAAPEVRADAAFAAVDAHLAARDAAAARRALEVARALRPEDPRLPALDRRVAEAETTSRAAR